MSRIAASEIEIAFGGAIKITEAAAGDGFVELTDAPGNRLWTRKTEGEARAGLVAAIVDRAKKSGRGIIEFRVWPDTRSRPDGKWSGYARVRF